MASSYVEGRAVVTYDLPYAEPEVGTYEFPVLKLTLEEALEYVRKTVEAGPDHTKLELTLEVKQLV